MTQARRYSAMDRCLDRMQSVLAVCAGVPGAHVKLAEGAVKRPYPAEDLPEPDLSEAERAHSAALLRVDHAGEVCAQALYEGQAAGAQTAEVATHMRQAAVEEADHLAWCQARLAALESHTSYLNPVWYAASFFLGYCVARCGDRWSLGFVMATEQQVEAHLRGHLSALPAQDAPSRVVLQTMMVDEMAHATQAQAGGGEALPDPLPQLMQCAAKIMTNLSHWW